MGEGVKPSSAEPTRRFANAAGGLPACDETAAAIASGCDAKCERKFTANDHDLRAADAVLALIESKLTGLTHPPSTSEGRITYPQGKEHVNTIFATISGVAELAPQDCYARLATTWTHLAEDPDTGELASREMPALLLELREAVFGGMESTGGAAGFRPRLPISDGALDLYEAVDHEIAETWGADVSRPDPIRRHS